MKLRRFGAVALAVLFVAALAALAPYWPCTRCESSGRLHDFNGALVTPSAYEKLRAVVKPGSDAVVACPVCDGRGRGPGWRSLVHLAR